MLVPTHRKSNERKITDNSKQAYACVLINVECVMDDNESMTLIYNDEKSISHKGCYKDDSYCFSKYDCLFRLL
jgi:hypothetical protein